MWPKIPYESWRETCEALHLFTQIAGKYRLARTPWVNHSWHATLYVTGRGLTTSLVPDRPGGIEIEFDLLDHHVKGAVTSGRETGFRLEPMSVAQFHARFRELVGELGGDATFDGAPNEVADPIPFARDRRVRPYQAGAVTRFFHALVSVKRVFDQFRTSFIGKVSPVHLFWGSLDLAVTRFSGRRAPLHPGGIPALPDEVTREAYSHEVSSCGFWPGDARFPSPAFYSYAYPMPEGFDGVKVEPAAAEFHHGLGEFVLPYEAVRRASDPEATLLAFLRDTYAAAADLGDWNRAELECEPGQPGRPRPL